MDHAGDRTALRVTVRENGGLLARRTASTLNQGKLPHMAQNTRITTQGAVFICDPKLKGQADSQRERAS
jgi:hypothetical protein